MSPENGEALGDSRPQGFQESVATTTTDTTESTDPYVEVRSYVQRVSRGTFTPIPVAGTPEWCALPDYDPDKLFAVLIAGTRWVLEQQMADIEAGHQARKDAACEVSEAADWVAVAKRVRDRDEAIRSGAYVERVSA